MKVKYTGSGPEALLLCKDKAIAKKILAYHHVRVPSFVISHRMSPLRRLKDFKFPAFVKPRGEESSDGISRASFARDEGEAIERAQFVHQKFDCDALIEEYIEGRELYVSVLGNRRLSVFPPREVFFDNMPADAPRFATYHAKWNDAYRKKWGITNGAARELPPGIEEDLRKTARNVYGWLKIRGCGRLDLRLTPNGELYVIEVNPNPSLSQDEDFAQSAAAGGMDYDALITAILQLAA
jgi:D-alanine-D-alanine ligase